jgi:hypothetical protein
MAKWNYYYIDPENCHHHGVNLNKAYRYARAMEEGDIFPAVQMGIDKRTERFCIRNGAHRTFAAKLAGLKLLVKTKAELKLPKVNIEDHLNSHSST